MARASRAVPTPSAENRLARNQGRRITRLMIHLQRVTMPRSHRQAPARAGLQNASVRIGAVAALREGRNVAHPVVPSAPAPLSIGMHFWLSESKTIRARPFSRTWRARATRVSRVDRASSIHRVAVHRVAIPGGGPPGEAMVDVNDDIHPTTDRKQARSYRLVRTPWL